MSVFDKHGVRASSVISVAAPSRITIALAVSALLFVLALLIPKSDAQSPALGFPTNASAESEKEEIVAIDRGTASFVVATNVPGVTVKGKSEALHGRAQIRRSPQGVMVDHVDVWLPISTLATGIALRDEHMRKLIFTTSSAELPDLHFEGGNADCAGVLAGHEAPCKVSGTLIIRGVPHEFSLTLKIREAGSAPLLRAGGDGLIRLSDYGIEAPSQFGVKTANEVQIHVEFPESAAVASAGGGR